MAVAHSWPLASDLGHLTRLDNNDAQLNTFVIAWNAHILPRDPLHLFDANIFYPEKRTLAYSETMAVQSAMAAPVFWLNAVNLAAISLLVWRL